MVRRIFRLVVVGWIAGMVAGSLAALAMKRRLVPTTDEGADDIVAVAIFGPLAFHSSSQQFRGGELECWYGGGVLDLRDAVLAPEGATLNVRAIFGGGQVLVPADWRVVTRIRGIGGISDVRQAKGFADDAPELVIEGVVAFGGFAVTSEMAEGEAEWLEGLKRRQGETASDEETEPASASDAGASAGADQEMAPAS
jgi:hypothetical protein